MRHLGLRYRIKTYLQFELALISLILTTFFSCSEVIEIEVPDFPISPVINCFITNDTVVKLRLSKTVNPLDSIPATISDARIWLYEDDVLAGELSYQNGFFISGIIPQSGKKYSIRAEIPEFPDIEEISANDFLPTNPIMTSCSFRDSALFDQDGFPVSQAEINIQDNSIGLQYYEVLLEMSYKRSSSDTVYENRIADYCKENYDPVLTKEGLIEFQPRTLVFSNETFSGQTYPLKINFQNELYLEDSYPQFKELKIIVHLRKVSESYYKYKRQLIIHQSSITSDFWSGTTEPSTMYSNIKGGYGVFAGYTEVVDTVTKFYNFIW